MKQGVVLEIEDDYLIMLTPDGEFLKAGKGKLEVHVGDEINFFPLTDNKEKKKKSRRIWGSKISLPLISAVAAVLLVFAFLPSYFTNEVYAYMSIDVNPSIEVGINKELEVVTIQSLNDEADELLQKLPDVKGMNVRDLADRIILECKEQGYLDNGGQVLITTVVETEHDQIIDETLSQNIEEITTVYEDEEIAVTTVESSKEMRDKASKQGVSTGKLLQLEKKVPVQLKEEVIPTIDAETDSNKETTEKLKPMNNFDHQDQDQKQFKEQEKKENKIEEKKKDNEKENSDNRDDSIEREDKNKRNDHQKEKEKEKGNNGNQNKKNNKEKNKQRNNNESNNNNKHNRDNQNKN